jgi:phage terminase Nu1 subunit (DNA packaging protein)
MADLISKTQFAQLIPCHPSYVSRLVKRGLPVKNGRIPRQAALAWLNDNVIPRKRKPVRDTAVVSDSKTNETPDILSRAEADRRLTAARARLLELEVGQKEGSLLDAQEVKKVWGAHVAAVRGRLLLMPGKLTTRIAALKGDEREIFCLLDKEVRATLTELSQYRAE